MTANGWAPPGLARRLFARLAAGNRAPSTIGPVPGTTRSGAGDPQPPAAAPEETIFCCACGQLLEDRTTARCWMAPEGLAVAADLACLLWLGETELGLTQ